MLLRLLIACCLVSTVFAKAPFFVTSPAEGSTFHPGETIILDWINGDEDGAIVQLYVGSDSNHPKPTGYGFRIPDGSDGPAKWTLPSNLPPNSYSFQFKYNNDEGVTSYTYSPLFEVVSGRSTSSYGQAGGEGDAKGTGATVGAGTNTGSGTAPGDASSSIPYIAYQPTVPTSSANTSSVLPVQSPGPVQPSMGSIAPNNVFGQLTNGASSAHHSKTLATMTPTVMSVAVLGLLHCILGSFI